MTEVLLILAAVLSAASVGLLVYWAAAIIQIARTVMHVPTARAGVALAEADRPAARVCVIIPAHNEQDILPRLIASLRGLDYEDFSVVLALDRCTDGSAQAARAAIGDDDRFEIVEIDQCPAEWAGKVHAVWTGVARSASAKASDYLVFADADTIWAPECLKATVGLARARQLDLLSLLSTLTYERGFERLAQPAAGFQLMHQYPILRANRDKGRRPFANGQFMMFRRDAYERVGGHEAVRDELLEDLALARAIDEKGLRAGVFLADGVLACRMYPDWPAFRRGWKRIYIEAAKRKPARLRRAAWRLRLVCALLPAAAGVNAALLLTTLRGEAAWVSAAATVSIAALTLWAAGTLLVYRLSRAPLAAVPGFAIGGCLVASILSEAASDLERGRPTQWGGRSYVRPAR